MARRKRHDQWEFISFKRDKKTPRATLTITLSGEPSERLEALVTDLIVILSAYPRLGQFQLK